MNELNTPYDVLSIPLPGGPGKICAAPLAESWNIFWDGVRLDASFLAPDNNPHSMLYVGSIDEPGKISREVAGARRAWRSVLAGDTGEKLRAMAGTFFGGLTRQLPPAPVEIELERVPGGWSAFCSRPGYDRTLAAYLPRDRRWLLYLSGPSDWFDAHRQRLARPRFRSPARELLLPFAADCLRRFKADARRVRSVMLNAQVTPEQLAGFHGLLGTDPFELDWRFEIVPETAGPLPGSEWVYASRLGVLYSAYLNDGMPIDALVDRTLSGIDPVNDSQRKLDWPSLN